MALAAPLARERDEAPCSPAGRPLRNVAAGPSRLPDAKGTAPRIPNRDHVEQLGSAQVDDQELQIGSNPMVTRCEVFFEVADRRIGREVCQLRSKIVQNFASRLGTTVVSVPTWRWLANPQRHAG